MFLAAILYIVAIDVTSYIHNIISLSSCVASQLIRSRACPRNGHQCEQPNIALREKKEMKDNAEEGTRPGSISLL